MKSVEIKDISKDYEAARSLVESFLYKERVSDAIVYETMLIFEAVCYNIYEQRRSDPPVITVTGRRRFGSAGIILNFEGDMYTDDSDDCSVPTPENRILSAYADRIDYIYRSRFNSIRIQARRSYAGATAAYLLTALLAVLVYFALHQSASAGTEEALHSNILFPLVTLFANAVMMVGAPVTFLSLLKNLTGTYILSERDSGIRHIARQTLASSAIFAALAIATCYAIGLIIPSFELSLGSYEELSVHMKLGEFIKGLMPSDILTPFQTISPFPLILLAGLVTYAFCSVGKHFDKMMDAIDVCYALFSRMLAIVMYTLPFFTFCAILDLLVVNGNAVLIYCGRFILIVLVSLIIPAVYYSIRLAARGISIPDFIVRLIPLLKENFKIASAIEAVPYNIRYCAKNFGIDRKSLESNMPVLAQINLDGNCFLLTLIALTLVIFSSDDISLTNVLLVAMLIFVLSLGAPNQPGSCIIGMLIILHYVQAGALVPFAIFAEVFFGTILNLMNVAGDIVTLMVNEKPDFRKE